MAILNQSLQGGLVTSDALLLKAWFLNSLGFNQAAAAMLGTALPQFQDPADRIQLLEEQSFVWAECQRGDEALRCADEAVGLGSNSVRTHYLRGRALGLLGRLDEARSELNQVLALDPTNADAQRGLQLILAAFPPDPVKRWWQFWKR